MVVVHLVSRVDKIPTQRLACILLGAELDHSSRVRDLEGNACHSIEFEVRALPSLLLSYNYIFFEVQNYHDLVTGSLWLLANVLGDVRIGFDSSL